MNKIIVDLGFTKNVQNLELLFFAPAYLDGRAYLLLIIYDLYWHIRANQIIKRKSSLKPRDVCLPKSTEALGSSEPAGYTSGKQKW